jgi:putative PIN family toxin of toxin-antitoxin system
VKAVFDTNVLIAAFVTEGICSKIFTRARKRQFRLLACPFIMGEFRRILVEKLSASRSEADEAIKLASEAIIMIVHPKQVITGVSRDPDDDNILACVLAANADYLVTGDHDLLDLHEFERTRIISPREFELLSND